jgi:V-type H+-transporting ATPase subunit a
MKRMIFRISRGRATPSFFDLNLLSTATRENVSKKIFTIFFPGGQENILMQKLVKVCDIYNASRFNLPRAEEMKAEIIHLHSDINEKDGYLKQARTLIDDFFREKIGSAIDCKTAKYDLYKLYIKKEKYIYHNLNKFTLRDNFVDGELWATEENFSKIRDEINKLSSDLSMSANFDDIPHSKLTPPTHIKSNDLTWVYQQITDAYGVPRYGEINPSLFSIITFPFLFGIMFGDIGHGTILLTFALYLVFWADEIRKTNSPLKPALKVRYLLMLMGISAHFMGWMYNDFLSIPFNIFGSCYINVSSFIDHFNS